MFFCKQAKLNVSYIISSLMQLICHILKICIFYEFRPFEVDILYSVGSAIFHKFTHNYAIRWIPGVLSTTLHMSTQ